MSKRTQFIGGLWVVWALASAAHAQSVVTPPPVSGGFDYQLAQRYQPAADVTIVSSDPHGGGTPLDTRLYNICYLNVFQTQPAANQDWLQTDLILMRGPQDPVVDDEWGELLFDVSTSDKQSRLLALQREWIAECKAAGYLAIEPDNLDSYTRSKGLLRAEHAQAYMQLFAAEAHAQGLAVAQKNTVEWVSEVGADGLVRAQSVGFDFAIVEECQVNEKECDQYVAYYQPSRVFEIEYKSRATFEAACRARGQSVRIVFRDQGVLPAGSPGYIRESCGPQAAPPAPTEAPLPPVEQPAPEPSLPFPTTPDDQTPPNPEPQEEPEEEPEE